MAPKTPITPKTVPSRVLTVVEWKQCSSCQSTYHARDSHGSVCATIGSGQPFSVKNHGFVLDKQLYGKITDECTECPSFQMKIEKTNLVFLSPAVMQLCGIQIGAPVSVNSLGIKSSGSILNAWPCPHLQPTSIFVHNDGKYNYRNKILFKLIFYLLFSSFISVLKILFTDSNALRILPVTQKCTVADDPGPDPEPGWGTAGPRLPREPLDWVTSWAQRSRSSSLRTMNIERSFPMQLLPTTW